jgi:hypothetical protein
MYERADSLLATMSPQPVGQSILAHLLPKWPHDPGKSAPWTRQSVLPWYEETARRHCGQLDPVRERVDGTTGTVATRYPSRSEHDEGTHSLAGLLDAVGSHAERASPPSSPTCEALPVDSSTDFADLAEVWLPESPDHRVTVASIAGK